MKFKVNRIQTVFVVTFKDNKFEPRAFTKLKKAVQWVKRYEVGALVDEIQEMVQQTEDLGWHWGNNPVDLAYTVPKFTSHAREEAIEIEPPQPAAPTYDEQGRWLVKGCLGGFKPNGDYPDMTPTSELLEDDDFYYIRGVFESFEEARAFSDKMKEEAEIARAFILDHNLPWDLVKDNVGRLACVWHRDEQEDSEPIGLEIRRLTQDDPTDDGVFLGRKCVGHRPPTFKDLVGDLEFKVNCIRAACESVLS